MRRHKQRHIFTYSLTQNYKSIFVNENINVGFSSVSIPSANVMKYRKR